MGVTEVPRSSILPGASRRRSAFPSVVQIELSADRARHFHPYSAEARCESPACDLAHTKTDVLVVKLGSIYRSRWV